MKTKRMQTAARVSRIHDTTMPKAVLQQTWLEFSPRCIVVLLLGCFSLGLMVEDIMQSRLSTYIYETLLLMVLIIPTTSQYNALNKGYKQHHGWPLLWCPAEGGVSERVEVS